MWKFLCFPGMESLERVGPPMPLAEKGENFARVNLACKEVNSQYYVVVYLKTTQSTKTFVRRGRKGMLEIVTPAHAVPKWKDIMNNQMKHIHKDREHYSKKHTHRQFIERFVTNLE